MEEKETKDYQDAEVFQSEEEKSEKNYRTEIILIFLIGILAGAMIKSEAMKRITIGFNDYKTITRSQDYDVEAIEKKLFEEAEKEAQNDESVPAEEGVVVEDGEGAEN